MKLAVIYVHYRTPELLARSVEALRRSLRAWSRETAGAGSYEILVVDNGDSREALDFLDPADDLELILSDRNRGYAGGINLGLDHARADCYLVLNPDVEVGEDCVAELLEALKGPAEVVGPRCFWDQEERLMMPPSDERSRTAELLTVLARRSGYFEARWRARWRRHARQHWLAEQPLNSEALTGAILAFSASALDVIGRFDEGFALYFEETDWLRRARDLAVPIYYVPSAHATHSYAQSTEKEPRSQQWFQESAHRFRRKHYGRAFTGLLERLARDDTRDQVELLPWPDPGIELDSSSRWVEVSPALTGVPAVAERLQPEAVPGFWRLPEELHARLCGKPLSVAVVDGAGHETRRLRLRV